MADSNDDIMKEIRLLRNDIENSRILLAGEKEAFRRKLMNGMGDGIVSELNSPRRYSPLTAMKVRLARWIKIRKERKQYK